MALTNIKKRLKAVIGFDAKAETVAILEQEKDVLIYLLQNQLKYGFDGDDNQVTVFGRTSYADDTIYEKRQMDNELARETRWITNYMYGDFYRMMKVEISADTYSIMSDVTYYEDILAQSGDRIMVLGEDSKAALREQILIPKLKERYKELSG